MEDQSKFGLANYILQFNLSNGRSKCSGQKYSSEDNEKSPRYKNREVEKGKIWQVGESHDSESPTRPVAQRRKSTAGREPPMLPENLAAWLRQTSVEIGLSGPTTSGDLADCVPEIALSLDRLAEAAVLNKPSVASNFRIVGA